jgi:hypothetical protein
MQASTRARSVPTAIGLLIVGAALLAGPRLGITPPILLPLPSVAPGATVLLAAGDIGSCDGTHDDDVADLAARLPGTIAMLGDTVYENGSASDYADCFDPVWASVFARIRPALGNHEYQTTDAAAYFTEFGATAGKAGEGWYSYELGPWHVVVLNSNCEFVGGCDAGSAQLAWLVADLAAHPSTCTLAYWHHPRYSSGEHGDDDRTESLWRALAAAGADLVLAGHDHDYERFALIDGIRSFVVGTGGRSLYEMPRPPEPGSELRANTSYGLLMLTLHGSSYDWRFVPAAGSTLRDAGSGACA